MRRWATVAVLGCLAAGLVGPGCGGFLSHDKQITTLTAKNQRLEDDLGTAEKKIAALTATGDRPVAPGETAEDPWRPVAIRFGKFTGMLEASRLTGGDRLKVVIEPLDATGDVVKRAGSLELEALEQAADGSTKPYARWTFAQEEFAKTWLSGLGSYAYVMKLSWPGGRPPTTDKLVLRARFTTLAGQTLAAETAVTLTRPAAPKPKTPVKPKDAAAPKESPAPKDAPAPKPAAETAK